MGYETLCWVLLGIGGLLWVMIQPLILGRILTGPAMPDRMRLALTILIAPPAVGAIALANLTHGFGPGPLILLGLAAFIAAVMATLVGQFARVPFSLAWWGWTFPTAAFAMSMLALGQAYPLGWVLLLGWLALLGASAILVRVSVATLHAARAGHLLQPDA
jgi:tellurite resistance protein